MKSLFVGAMLAVAAFAASAATPPPPSLALRCESWVQAVTPSLPHDMDSVTRLTGVSCDSQATLVAEFVVHDLKAGSAVDWVLAKNIVIADVCKQPNNWMGDGLTARYKYYDPAGQFLNAFTFNQGDCPGPNT